MITMCYCRYSESVRSERGPPLYTDSDSARSSASTGARSKDGSTYGPSKYFMVSDANMIKIAL